MFNKPLAKKNPLKTSTILSKLLAKIFTKASLIAPSLNKFIVSNAKVENVVKPPKNPTNIKVRICGEMPRSSKAPQISPIKNAPDTFTSKVPQGKTVSEYLYGKPEIRYLKNVPSAPPPNNNKSLIILKYFHSSNAINTSIISYVILKYGMT